MSRASSSIMLVVSASLVMISSQLYHSPMLSEVSELFSPKYRSRTLGPQGAGGTVGIALGPISLGILMEKHSWHSVYLLWAIPVFVSIITLSQTKTLYEEENGSVEEKQTGHQDTNWYSWRAPKNN